MPRFDEVLRKAWAAREEKEDRYKMTERCRKEGLHESVQEFAMLHDRRSLENREFRSKAKSDFVAGKFVFNQAAVAVVLSQSKKSYGQGYGAVSKSTGISYKNLISYKDGRVVKSSSDIDKLVNAFGYLVLREVD